MAEEMSYSAHSFTLSKKKVRKKKKSGLQKGSLIWSFLYIAQWSKGEKIQLHSMIHPTHRFFK